MKFLFVGGPGRSGTTFFAQQLIEHPHIAGFFDVELKLYSETDGLLDLYNSFGPQFGPNRAYMAVRRLKFLFDALFKGASDQAPLTRYVKKPEAVALVDRTAEALGYPAALRRASDAEFFNAARILSNGLADLARRQPGRELSTVFLEKTPHVLLHTPFLRKLHPDAVFIHVMRDPRSVASSLQRMEWGPSAIEDCAAWVAGYWGAYRDVRHWARVNHVTIAEFYAETIASSPEGATQSVCDMLDVPRVPNLFTWGDLSRLNGWVEKATSTELSALNSLLGDLAVEIGYRRDAVGVRAQA